MGAVGKCQPVDLFGRMCFEARFFSGGQRKTGRGASQLRCNFAEADRHTGDAFDMDTPICNFKVVFGRL